MWFVNEGLGYLIWIQIDIMAYNEIAHHDQAARRVTYLSTLLWEKNISNVIQKSSIIGA